MEFPLVAGVPLLPIQGLRDGLLGGGIRDGRL